MVLAKKFLRPAIDLQDLEDEAADYFLAPESSLPKTSSLETFGKTVSEPKDVCMGWICTITYAKLHLQL